MGEAKPSRIYAIRLRREAIGRALADCFRLRRIPPVPEVTARVYDQSGESQRAALLTMLLKSVGPLALAVLAAGRFAHYMYRERWSDLVLTLDDIREVTANQVAEIARYVEQANPDVVRSISDWLAAHPATLAVLGAGAVATLVQFAVARYAAPRLEHAGAPAREDRDWLDD